MAKIRLMSVSIVLFLLVSFMASAGGQREAADGVTTLNFWVFNALHAEFFRDAETRWNQANPNRQIRLEITETPAQELQN